MSIIGLMPPIVILPAVGVCKLLRLVGLHYRLETKFVIKCVRKLLHYPLSGKMSRRPPEGPIAVWIRTGLEAQQKNDQYTWDEAAILLSLRLATLPAGGNNPLSISSVVDPTCVKRENLTSSGPGAGWSYYWW